MNTYPIAHAHERPQTCRFASGPPSGPRKLGSGPAIPCAKLQLLVWIALTVLLAHLAGSALAQDVANRAERPVLKVGDRWKYQQSDRLTGNKESELAFLVSAVSDSRIEGSDGGGTFVWTPELNLVSSSVHVVSGGEDKRLVFPLELGKKWEYKYELTNKEKGMSARREIEATVVAYEKVKVPAGEYDAFRIEYKGYWRNLTSRMNGRLKIVSWFAPAARNIVRTEYDDGYNKTLFELAETQLQP